MTLRHLPDVSSADWFADETTSPLRLQLGPAGFESYARVLHSEMGDGERFEGHLEDDLLAALIDVLEHHTTTPTECFFGLWDGYGSIYGGEAALFLTAFAGPMRWPGRIFKKEKPPPPIPPAFSPAVMNGPLLDHLGEAYFLFGGSLSDAGRWGAAGLGGGIPRDINSPNLMWPADRAWFVTTNIDGTWSGVGGSTELIDELLRDRRLEVVRQRYDAADLR